MNALETFAQWAATTTNLHSPNAVLLSTHAVIDTFACMIAGVGEPGPVTLRRALPLLAGVASGPATILGQDAGAPPVWAALANGTAAHAHDLDDTFLPAINHPSSVMTAALLALAQQRNFGGAKLIDAYIVGLELHYYLARGLMRSHADLGFHTTATVGSIAAAGACARLLGLDVPRMAHALSLGVSTASGIKGQAGTMAKPLHAGLAAQHGVEAALLAQAGYEGRLAVLDGEWGYLQVCGGPDAQGWNAEMLKDVGKLPLAIESKGLMVKRFPCCASTHRVVDSLLELRAEHGFGPADVEHITATVPAGNYRNLLYFDPKTDHEAKFSMQYTLAAALQRGTLSFEEYTPQALADPAIRALMPRVEMLAREAGAEKSNAEIVPPHKLVVKLKDGRTFERDRAHARGTIFDPLNDADRWDKFSGCCAGTVSSSVAESMYARLGQLAQMKDVNELVAGVFTPVREGLRQRDARNVPAPAQRDATLA